MQEHSEEFDELAEEHFQMIDQCANAALDQLLQKSLKKLSSIFETRLGFEQRLYERWGEAINLLELIYAVSLEAGIKYKKKHQGHDIAENDYVFDVLARTHARACTIISEILALLRTGHATGALARWRTLHELAVVAYFINKHGQETAERYLLHEVIESCKAANAYKDCYQRLGYEKIHEDEISELDKMRAELKDRFGRNYLSDYGWAADALSMKSPRITDIEHNVELDHFRAHYKMASHGIHLNPKGLKFNIGLLGKEKFLLAGASNAGLAEPANLAIISFNQITSIYLTYRPDEEALVKMQVLLKLATMAENAFVSIHEQQVDEVFDDDSGTGAL